MVTKAVLEKRIQRLKNRLRKARDAGEEAPPRPLVRRIRKRLKHNQRKLRAGMARQEKAGAETGSSETQTG